MENCQTDERRRLERFEMNAPARIHLERENGKKQELTLTTKDLSSAGAFIFSSSPVPEGTVVKIEFVISLETLQRLVGEKGKVRVRVKGKVIRIDEEGMAVQFDHGCKITPSDDTAY